MSGIDHRRAMADSRPQPRGRFTWIASDFVLVQETEEPDCYALSVLPADAADCAPSAGRLQGDVPLWERVLVRLRIPGPASGVTYLADTIERGGVDGYAVVTPWGGRGVLVETSAAVSVDLAQARIVSDDAGTRVYESGRWFVALRGSFEPGPKVVSHGGVTVAVGASARSAVAELDRLAGGAGGSVREASAHAWNDYFESCPVLAAASLRHVDVDDALFRSRQLWHWWAARANVVRSIADPGVVFVAPDRARWLGSWSSDAPVTMAALAMTSSADAAAEVFLRYVRSSIDQDGHLAWYTHPDGRPCLGRLGDTGVLSRGLPEIVWAADAIAEHVPRLASAPGIQGRDILSTLHWYLKASADRDVNADGLWETSHLWEGAWDNKIAPMFRDTGIDEWVAAMQSRDPGRVGAFFAANARPSTTMVEQAAYVRAVLALGRLAVRADELVIARWAAERAAHVVSVVRSRQWHAESGTYRDWDVTAGRLNDADCLDGFYFLEFESDPVRRERLVEALCDPARFGFPRPPTLARDDPRFLPDQYWDGSYWPREMAYIAPGLAAVGRPDLAERILIEALFSGEGKEVLEHMNSDTGGLIRYHDGEATVYSQAMSVGLCLALCRITQEVA